MGRDDRKAFPDGRHLRLGRLPSGSERVAGSLDHVPQRRRAHDEGLVPAAVGGGEEGQQRVQMTGAPQRASCQYPHGGEA